MDNRWLYDIHLIQGGMGAGVSNYNLARTVSTHKSNNALGVISGVALEQIQLRRLQEGNEDVANSLLDFPDKEFKHDFIEKEMIDKYFVDGGVEKKGDFKGFAFPVLNLENETDIRLKNKLEKLIVASTFAEVNLAKKDHDNPVGVNLLYEIEWPMMPSIYGAMVGGADAFLIGAGLPNTIPSVLDSLSNANEARMSAEMFDLEGKKVNGYNYLFDPSSILKNPEKLQRRPLIAIINGHLAARGVSNADAYVIEGPTAGGHNPPARSKELTKDGEPLYGPRDDLDLDAFKSFLLKNSKQRNNHIQPFWFAGEYFDRLSEARNLWANGVQVGTPFAFSYESGIPNKNKESIIKMVTNENGLNVYTDPRASPSGFPFKVIQINGSLSEKEKYEERNRVCDIGHLVDPYITPEGNIGVRCPSEPIDAYLRKGGKLEETIGRKCLCNGLVSTIGLGTRRKNGNVELPIYTSGANHDPIRTMVKRNGINYSASDVVDYILEN